MSKLVTLPNGRTQIVGRKSILTPEFTEKFAEVIGKCLYMSIASEAMGVNRQTPPRWIREADIHIKQSHPDGDDCTVNCDEDIVAKRAFSIAVKTAVANSKVEKLDSIDKAGNNPRNWTAKAWILERTDPDNFGMRNRTDVKVSGSVNHRHTLDTSKRAKLLEIAQKSQQLAIETTQDEDGVYSPVQSE
jgi:hypothetical protein